MRALFLVPLLFLVLVPIPRLFLLFLIPLLFLVPIPRLFLLFLIPLLFLVRTSGITPYEAVRR